MKTIALLRLHILLLVTILVQSLQAYAATFNYGTVIIDQSVSMNKLRADNVSRCEVAINLANQAVREFFDELSGKKLNIKIFGSKGKLKSITNGFASRSESMQALAGLSKVCNLGLTALGDAICSSIDELRSYAVRVQGHQRNLTIFVMTDGLENDSEVCGGLKKIEPNLAITKTWHQKVFDMVITNQEPIVFSARIFWPDEEPVEDFEFLKFLTIVTGSNHGGAYSASTGASNIKKDILQSSMFKSYYQEQVGLGSLVNDKSSFKIISDYDSSYTSKIWH